MQVELKSKAEIELLREAGAIVATILAELEERVQPGVSTAELDAYAEARCRDFGARPAFKGYREYPATLCTSRNEQVVHGIPNASCVLREGDILSVDFGVQYRGFYGDSARTFAVGEVREEVRALLETTEQALEQAIEHCQAGNRLGDLGHAIQTLVERRGFSVVREYVGHGIGRSLHEEPQVKNYGPAKRGYRLREGVVIAIEPMVNIGGYEVQTLDDAWTVVTKDRSWSAHFEHMVAITEDGPQVLTRSPTQHVHEAATIRASGW